MITSSGLVFLAMLNMFSFQGNGWDADNPAFSSDRYTVLVSARTTAGQLNTYSFDPFPWSAQFRTQLLKRGSALGARLDFGYESPFHGEAAPYLRALYASYRLNIAGRLEGRAGWIALPFRDDLVVPFALRAAGLDFRGLTVMQGGTAWYDVPVDFIPAGGLGLAAEHRFPFGLEIGAGYTFLPNAFYGRAAYEFRKGTLFIRPEFKLMVFEAEDVELTINPRYAASGEPSLIKRSGSGMSVASGRVIAGIGSLLFEAEFGRFAFNQGGFSTADGLAGNWLRAGGGLVVYGARRGFLQALVLRGDVSYRSTDRDGEGDLLLGITASATVLHNLELTAGYSARFPEQENTEPKGYIYLGAGYTMKLQF